MVVVVGGSVCISVSSESGRDTEREKGEGSCLVNRAFDSGGEVAGRGVSTATANRQREEGGENRERESAASAPPLEEGRAGI